MSTQKNTHAPQCAISTKEKKKHELLCIISPSKSSFSAVKYKLYLLCTSLSRSLQSHTLRNTQKKHRPADSKFVVQRKTFFVARAQWPSQIRSNRTRTLCCFSDAPAEGGTVRPSLWRLWNRLWRSRERCKIDGITHQHEETTFAESSSQTLNADENRRLKKKKKNGILLNMFIRCQEYHVVRDKMSKKRDREWRNAHVRPLCNTSRSRASLATSAICRDCHGIVLSLRAAHAQSISLTSAIFRPFDSVWTMTIIVRPLTSPMKSCSK